MNLSIKAIASICWTEVIGRSCRSPSVISSSIFYIERRWRTSFATNLRRLQWPMIFAVWSWPIPTGPQVSILDSVGSFRAWLYHSHHSPSAEIIDEARRNHMDRMKYCVQIVNKWMKNSILFRANISLLFHFAENVFSKYSIYWRVRRTNRNKYKDT